MPGELNNPQNWFPFHYQPCYAPGTNQFDAGSFDMDEYLKSLAIQQGARLSPKSLSKLKDYLEARGVLSMNPGDQAFTEPVKKFVKMLLQARKVAARYARHE